MPKPTVLLITRNCFKCCRCGLGRNLLEELKEKGRCDGREFNLDELPKDHFMVKYARGCGLCHFPTFIIQHPQQKIPDVKVWGNDAKGWTTGQIRQQVEAAITAVWKAK